MLNYVRSHADPLRHFKWTTKHSAFVRYVLFSGIIMINALVDNQRLS